MKTIKITDNIELIDDGIPWFFIKKVDGYVGTSQLFENELQAIYHLSTNQIIWS